MYLGLRLTQSSFLLFLFGRARVLASVHSLIYMGLFLDRVNFEIRVLTNPIKVFLKKEKSKINHQIGFVTKSPWGCPAK